jgi:hypothetical protein
VFGVFALRELGAESFGADDELAWCLPESRPFQLRYLQESRAREPGAIHALGLEWVHSNVGEHRELGRRFMLHGVPTWFFFHRDQRLGAATGSHNLGSFRPQSRPHGRRSGQAMRPKRSTLRAARRLME